MRAFYLLASLVVSAVAAPAPSPRLSARQQKTAASLILAVMPTSNSCTGAQFPDECRTADQAAPFIIQGFDKYGVRTYGEIAAIVSLMGVESDDLKFKHNISPGRPGQGTVNMQMVNFNTLYATDLFGAAKVAGLAPNDVLALVTPDQYNFASAAWFYSTQCSQDVKNALKQGNDAGFAAYMGCVGVSPDASPRPEYWQRAKTAFGL